MGRKEIVLFGVLGTTGLKKVSTFSSFGEERQRSSQGMDQEAMKDEDHD